MKKIIVIGTGLGGLATALRLVSAGYSVTLLEKDAQAGGRLNQLKSGQHVFDLGPSFMSMSYELRELFDSCGLPFPFDLKAMDPEYQVFFNRHSRPFRIWKDPSRFAAELAELESGLEDKVRRYLQKAKEFYQDTEKQVIHTNFFGPADYARKLSRVPLKHLPYLFRNMWTHAGQYFQSEEIKVIFTLVSFFLGSTPLHTPAIYSLLNYIEMQHDGYWVVKGGMYRIVEVLVRTLEEKGVAFVYNTEIRKVHSAGGRAVSVEDQNGRRWEADIFVCNADAAAFRGLVLSRAAFRPQKLDKMEWSLGPFTMYLGVKGKLDQLLYHNYFLGDDFLSYAKRIFKSDVIPENPYYYVNVLSQAFEGCSPPGTESLFILCPVPDLRFKPAWEDKDLVADRIIEDLSRRIRYDLRKNTLTRQVLTPEDWGRRFNLYQGSGLGLCHGIRQIGGFRPANKDEEFCNFYYVGASTIPGTGLPMVIISSKLVQERILRDG